VEVVFNEPVPSQLGLELLVFAEFNQLMLIDHELKVSLSRTEQQQ